MRNVELACVVGSGVVFEDVMEEDSVALVDVMESDEVFDDRLAVYEA